MTIRPAFRMPPLPQRWQGADGREHAYGERWGVDAPSEDAYSRVTHPERYAPLHEVADALVAHLLTEYECTASPDATVGRELRAVRVQSAPGTAAVRIAWTEFPGVLADLGGDISVTAPVCGCDACDEALEHAAEQCCDRVLTAVSQGPGAWPLRSPESRSST